MSWFTSASIRILLILAALAFSKTAEAVPEGNPCVPEPTVQLIPYGAVVTCQIGLVGDLDSFNFAGVAGETIAVLVAATGGGGSPCVEVFDPDGIRIGLQTCLIARIDAPLTKTGQHTILISEFQNNGTMDYTLTLERTDPPSPPSRRIDFGQGLGDALDPVGDMDTFFFTGRAGDAVTLLVSPTAAGPPCVELFDPDGIRVGLQTCIIARIDAVLTKDGQHTILVTEFQNNGVMDYRLDLQCIGQCPRPPFKDDVAIDFGARGLWVLFNNAATVPLTEVSEDLWSPLAGNASLLASGDIDGNGKADLIANFPGWGVWIWMNNAAWIQLHAFDASRLHTGDLDGNGLDEIIITFPGYGVWARVNNASWMHLHSLEAGPIATGDIDGNGKGDLIVDFPGFGLWIWLNNASWVPLHAADATALEAGDLDGNGMDDVVINFPGSGLWVRFNNATWVHLHSSNVTRMATGNIDGDAGRRADLIANFPGFGVWAWINNGGWTNLHASNVNGMATGNIDGDAAGRADVILSFPTYGVWAWLNNGGYIQLHTLDPENLVSADFDGL